MHLGALTMKSIIKSLIELKHQYPKWINLYPPSDPKEIHKTEKLLQFEVDEHLKEIYKVTDGFGIVDYCLSGINNKRINSIISQNLPLTFNEQYESNTIEFLGTSGDENYHYIINSNNQKNIVIKSEGFKSQIVSESVEEFLDKFLRNMKILLETIRDEDIVMYLDDERLEGKILK